MDFETTNSVETNDTDQIVVDVQNVSKNYCRDLKKSLWYGIKDIFRELTFRGSYSGKLREQEFPAVDDVSFTIKKGESVALLGPNGAGKSSMLKLINGILRPNKGTIRINGRVSALIELGTGFNPILSGRENVFINAAILGFTKEETEERLEKILAFSEIGKFIDAPVQSYSSGMRLRLGFAVASHLSPDLLLIDEVLAVGDLGFRLKCFDHLQKQVESGIAVVLVSHIVTMIPKVCNRSIVFRDGKIEFDGDVTEGITEYQKILGLENAKRSMVQMLGDELGTGEEPVETELKGTCETSIKEIRTFNDSQEPCTVFQTGGAIDLEIEFTSSVQRNKCKLVVNLCTPQFGDISAMPSARSGFQFDIHPDTDDQKSIVRLSIPSLPLIEGGYSFNVTLYGEDASELVDQKMSLGSFTILNKKEKAKRALKGVLALEHYWSINNEK